MQKSADALRTIGEVSQLIGVQPHVLRYWETQFPQLAPIKRPDGRRYYRAEDLCLAAGLVELLREDGMTTRGAQKQLARDKGAMLRERGRARLPQTFGDAGTEAVPPKPRKPRALPRAQTASAGLPVDDDAGVTCEVPDAAATSGLMSAEGGADATAAALSRSHAKASDEMPDLRDDWQADTLEDPRVSESDHWADTAAVLGPEPESFAPSAPQAVTAAPLMRLHALAARLRNRPPHPTAALARQRAALAALLSSR